MTRLKALNIKFESMNFNHLKSMLLFCFKSETQKILKNINVSFNCSEIVNTLKNFWFMFFSISVDVNNINKLHIADRKCHNDWIQFWTWTVYFRQQEFLCTHKSESDYQKSINFKEIFEKKFEVWIWFFKLK